MEINLRAPKQFNVFVYQLFGALFLLMSFLFLIVTIVSVIQWSPKDILIGSALFFPPLILGAAIIYFTQKHIPFVTIDTIQEVLKIKRKGQDDEIHQLREIKKFIFILKVFPFPGVKEIKIIAELNDETNVKILSDETVFFEESWELFSEEISETTRKPLKKENFIDHHDLLNINEQRVKRNMKPAKELISKEN